MWVRLDTNGYFDTAIYADWWAADAATAGGVAFELGRDPDIDRITAQFLFPDPGNVPADPHIACSGGYCTGTIDAPVPALGQWHFYRLVRDVASDQIRFCLDGVLAGTAPLAGEIDISNPRSPTFGSWDTLARPTFDGDIDDLRIFRRTLPCGP